MKAEDLNINEQISALVDGQLSDDAVAQVMQLLVQDEQARANWHAYHLVGDVLRSQELSWSCANDVDFLTRLRNQLQPELLPLQSEVKLETMSPLQVPEMITNLNVYPQEAANDSSRHWKWAAGLASLGLMVVLGWGMLDRFGASSGGAELAQLQKPAAQTQAAQAQTGPTQAAVIPDEAEPILIRDPSLDRLLQAHRQFGSGSVLQMSSGFVRNANFDRPVQ